jgi:hypothetical protein
MRVCTCRPRSIDRSTDRSTHRTSYTAHSTTLWFRSWYPTGRQLYEYRTVEGVLQAGELSEHLAKRLNSWESNTHDFSVQIENLVTSTLVISTLAAP